MTIKSYGKAWFLTGLLLGCSHDSKRDNPLDPALTPQVELQVALDDTSGIATLTQSRYHGETSYAEYLVLRNIQESTRVDTVTRIESVGATSFVDTTMEANTAYEYRVAVVNTGGFQASSREGRTAGYSIGSVTLLSARYDPQRGGVVVSWSRFAGSRFHSYRVERISADKVDFEPIGSPVASATDTVFTDTAVVSDAFYRYRVVVEAAGREWRSNSSVPSVSCLVPCFCVPWS